MTSPRVSFVVPAFDASAYVESCLDSLLAVGEGTEILLVDDGSRDDTVRRAEARLASRGNHRVLPGANGGPGAARNRGLREARGDYVVFVDCDDRVFPEVLRRVLDRLVRRPVDLLAADYLQCFEGEDRTERVRRDLPEDPKDPQAQERLRARLLYRRYKPLVWAHVYRRERLLEEGLFFLEGRCFEDEEWVPRALLGARTLGVFPEPWYLYRRRAGSVSTRVGLRGAEDKVFVAEALEVQGDEAAASWKPFFRYAAQRILRSALRDLEALPEEDPGKESLLRRIRERGNLLAYWRAKVVKILRERLV